MINSIIKNPELLNVTRHIATLAGWGNFSVTPVVYNGLIDGSEFVTYAIDKLYVAQQMQISGATGGGLPATGRVALYDHANALHGYLRNLNMVYDGADVLYMNNDQVFLNIWFSRVIRNNYSYMMFVGYRLNAT